MSEELIQSLAKSNTIGTLLPTAAYFLRMPFQPARKLIDAGSAIAIASDYNPGSKLTYVLYAAAIGATGVTVYLRHIAGKHFPSDLLTGVTVGTLSGILVPQLHKHKVKDSKLGFIPCTDGQSAGFYLTYKIR